MKKIIMLFALIFMLNIPYIYAQYGDYYDGTNSYNYDDKPAAKKSSLKYDNKKHYIGVSPSLYIPTGKDAYIKNYTGVGGGIDLKYQYSLHKIFALAGAFRYNYAGGTDIYKDAEEKTDHHLMDFHILAVLQYDDVNVTKGFVPYISVGMDISVSVVDIKNTSSSYQIDSDGATYLTNKITRKERQSSANVGFIAGGGLRYVFTNNFTTGIGVDYTHVFTNHDYSGVRVFVDLGYKF